MNRPQGEIGKSPSDVDIDMMIHFPVKEKYGPAYSFVTNSVLAEEKQGFAQHLTVI